MSVIKACTKFLRSPSLTNPTTGLRRYAFKSDLKIKWVRPEKIPYFSAKRSGDLVPMTKINNKEFADEYRNSEELQDADELVQKLFTLELQPRKKMVEIYTKEMISSVQRHPADTSSPEVVIARLTAVVRSLQEQVQYHPSNYRLKVTIKEIMEKRNKKLKLLRLSDYKKFEWIIEKLDIVYKPMPLTDPPPTRKGSLRKLTQKYCDDIKSDKIKGLRKKLEDEQPIFLEEKIRALEFIRDEQKELGVDLTVSEEDVNKVKEQLKNLHEKKQATQTE